jgi:hypothetical protein
MRFSSSPGEITPRVRFSVHEKLGFDCAEVELLQAVIKYAFGGLGRIAWPETDEWHAPRDSIKDVTFLGNLRAILSNVSKEAVYCFDLVVPVHVYSSLISYASHNLGSACSKRKHGTAQEEGARARQSNGSEV